MIPSFIIEKYISFCGFEGITFKYDKWNFRCNICGDSKTDKKKKRGYILIKDESYIYYCHNCNTSISFDRYLKEYKPELYNDYKKEIFEFQVGINKKEKIYKTEKETLQSNICINYDVLNKLEKITPNSNGWKYCIDRKIPKSFIESLYYSYNYMNFIHSEGIYTFENENKIPNKDERIIIPIFDKYKQLTYLQGRSINKNNNLRYMTVELIKRSHKIWGENIINKKISILVFEGVLDACYFENALAFLGGSSNMDYIFNEYTPSKLIYCPDKDVWKNNQIKKIASQFIDRGGRVCLIPKQIKGKDINDMINNGMNINEIKEIIKTNIYSGIEAKVRLL
jgi:transcription elongation factor Elf1